MIKNSVIQKLLIPLKLFQIETINVFYPQGGWVWWALAPSLSVPFSPTRGGGGVKMICISFEFPEFCCRLLIFLASEERAPKQLKQVSTVGRNCYTDNQSQS